MSVIKELLCRSEGGGISFGDYELDSKTKLSDFEYQGDLYKVKTFKDITKLERNETFVYESVPGTAVHDMKFFDGGVEFSVEGAEDAQITLGMEEGDGVQGASGRCERGSYDHESGRKTFFQCGTGKGGSR